MKNQPDYWKEFESRLEENQQLLSGGLPIPFKQIGSLIGLRFWQSLLIISGLISLVIYLVAGAKLINLVEFLLLIF